MVLLDINGTLRLTFFDLTNGLEVSDEVKQEIVENLQSGDYVIELANGVVRKLPSFEQVATFKFEVEDNTEYEFIEEGEDED